MMIMMVVVMMIREDSIGGDNGVNDADYNNHNDSDSNNSNDDKHDVGFNGSDDDE